MKKLNKFFAVLVALAMMATLCVSMAFAERENPPVEVKFTKTWATNEGTTTTAKDFAFTVTQDTTAGVSNTATIQGQTIHFDANKTGTKASTDLLAGQTWTDTAGKVVPGKYVYTIKETIPAAGEGQTKDENVITEVVKTNGDKTTTTKTTTYATDEYTMEVYVDKTGKVTGVVIKKGADKITYEEPVIDENGNATANGFNFRNTYSEKVTTTPTGSDPEDQDPDDIDASTLYVQKVIDANADQIDENKEFNFSITVAFPAIDAQDSYTAKVVDKDGNVVTTAGGTNGVFTFTKDTAATLTQNYKLRHGDRLVFENIDIGATYLTSETDEFAPGDDYSYVSGNVAEATPVTAENTFAEIHNKFEKGGTPDSGILISNLPYIALALVAIGGLVAYVVVRRRQSDEA